MAMLTPEPMIMLLSSSFVIFRQIGIAYVSATSSAVAVSVGLNTFVKVKPH